MSPMDRKRPLKLPGVLHKKVVQLKAGNVNLNWRFLAKRWRSQIYIFDLG